MRFVDRVQQALRDAGLDITVVELAESTATAPQAAAAVGAPLGSIVKSLIFMAAGEPLLVLVAGDQTADARRIARLLGISKKKVRIARAPEVEAVAGCRPGGVPPVGHLRPLRTLIDRTLSRFETVWAAAGAPNAVFPIAYTQLLTLTGGEVVEITQEMGDEAGRG
ncbi:MAG: YbaK/EbsC family protein [Chloroflexi bacterium]|nr:YbaK/EbsC family protein [Chloroflexota bacterium]